MAKMVGLSRNIKLSWLNRAVDFLQEELSENEIRENLNDYLSFEIKSPTNLRKTREILMTIWVYENKYSTRIKDAALALFRQYPDQALVIHWCMILAAYPVFMDMCKLIGKMSEFQDEITLAQIKQKLFDEWGERTTLFHSIDKLMATMKDFDVLTSEKPGRYQIQKHAVRNERITSFMVYTVMNIDDAGYYTIQELNSSNYLFPFEYQMAKETILQDDRFVINNFGGELAVSLKTSD